MNFEQTVQHWIERERQKHEHMRLPQNSWFLDEDTILNYPRETGDSRYPLDNDGYTAWVHSSGYIYAREGRIFTLPYCHEGNDPGVNFFLNVKDNGDYLSLLGLPVSLNRERCKQFSVFTPKAAYYITLYGQWQACVRVFNGPEKTLYFSIYVKNTGSQSEEIALSSFICPHMMTSGVQSKDDRWGKTARIIGNAENNMDSFLVDFNRGQIFSVINNSVSNDEAKQNVTVSKDSFVGGKRRNAASLKSIAEKKIEHSIHSCHGISDVCYGDIITAEIAPGQNIRRDLSMSYFGEKSEAEICLAQKLEGCIVDRLVEEAQQKDIKNRPVLHVGAFRDGILDNEAFNCFIKTVTRQVESCALGKVYGWSDMLGIRDIYQQIETALLWVPQKCRKRIVESMGMIAVNGKAPRQYAPPVLHMEVAFDQRDFIDQGVWIISTLSAYLKATGDSTVLCEMCGYYELPETGDKGVVHAEGSFLTQVSSGKTVRSEREDTVLEHLIQITEYLLSCMDEETHCIRILYGDWNDAVDGLGKDITGQEEYGTGVSVMASLQVLQNLQEMQEILMHFGNGQYNGLIGKYKEREAKLEQGLMRYGCVKNEKGERRILHGWGDRRSYLVGSFEDADKKDRVGLAAAAFWTLSKLYDKDTTVRKDILKAYRRLDSSYGFRTFDIPFEQGTDWAGRICDIPPGMHENACTYCHATAFGILSLFRMGQCKEAWEQIFKIIPLTHEFLSHSPYVMPNSYMHNPGFNIDGHSQADWQTGSGTVLLKALIKYVFGYQPQIDGLWISPCKELPFDSFDFEVSPGQYHLKITYQNRGGGQRSFVLNGQPVQGVFNPLTNADELRIPQSAVTKVVEIQIFD